MATAYSYIRFSTEKQERGASLARQIQMAKKYAIDHNLTLNAQTYQDLGVSASKGRNSTEGDLAIFLKACDDKIIPKGSYLLVESLDRLSREDVQSALRLFQNIVAKGIVIVTLSDGQVYSTESINQNWTQLIVALAVMSRANEETKLKTERIRDGWSKKKEKALTGGVILTAKGPSWLKLVDGKWVLNKEKVKAVKRVFELSLMGHGTPKIAKLMNEKFKIPPLATAKFWTQSAVGSVLASKAVIGIFQRRERPDEIIEGYYPPIIAPETFYAVREKTIERRRKAGIKGEVVSNLFSGLIYCPCGSKMRSVNSNKKNYYIRCLRAYSNAGCDAPIIAYAPFEHGVLHDLLLVHRTPLDNTATIQEDPLVMLRGEIEEKRKLLDKLVQAIELSDGKPTVIVKRIAQIEFEISKLEKELNQAFKPTPIKTTTDQALELLDRHAILIKNGLSTELHELRQRMYSTIHALLTKIIVRTDIGEFEASEPRNGKTFTWLWYEMQGPLVEALRKEKNDRHLMFTNDGSWGNCYVVNKSEMKNLTTRRRVLKKSLIHPNPS